MINRRVWIVLVTLTACFALVAIRERRINQRVSSAELERVAAPTIIDAAGSSSVADETTMADVLELAKESLATMHATVHDYTARFVKQERDAEGNLGEVTEMKMKAMPRHRDGKLDAPMRVYLDFQKPASQVGREVIWAEDLYDGQLVVHEGGFLGMLTVRLDPNGFMAMRGQRFPISQIGLTRLVELLIERGTLDLDNPDISVAIIKGHEFDGIDTELIQVRRAKPSGLENDFSLAEIVIDRKRMLVLQYRSFGWNETADGTSKSGSTDAENANPPLIESYTYHDIKTNVGLTGSDFDPENPEYRYP